MVDQIDLVIINCLTQNAKMQLQEIGEIVHMSGQAVKNRINKLENLGIIEGYTLKVNGEKLGMSVTGYVTVFMKTMEHEAFSNYLKTRCDVLEAHRISGEGCYLLKVQMENQSILLAFLDEILKYGNYKINLSIHQIK